MHLSLLDRRCHPLLRSKLLLFLPNRVEHKRGDAKWDGAKETLVISLPVASGGLLGM